ncbi:hypothetical protein ACGF12_21555 [Kitasatospora sp. NPDC048296]|uniref:hypothetical protein n=1 Tax=Kitasatospora sp. NPDC048296 TaxID=3364048 RepID=UPI0037181AFC
MMNRTMMSRLGPQSVVAGVVGLAGAEGACGAADCPFAAELGAAGVGGCAVFGAGSGLAVGNGAAALVAGAAGFGCAAGTLLAVFFGRGSTIEPMIPMTMSKANRPPHPMPAICHGLNLRCRGGGDCQPGDVAPG